jgi:hypothetical protein
MDERITYRKKPHIVEAMQFNLDGKTDEEVQEFFTWLTDGSIKRDVGLSNNNTLFLLISEGLMKVRRDEWIIKGSNGEFYSCDPETFEDIFEKI